MRREVGYHVFAWKKRTKFQRKHYCSGIALRGHEAKLYFHTLRIISEYLMVSWRNLGLSKTKRIEENKNTIVFLVPRHYDFQRASSSENTTAPGSL